MKPDATAPATDTQIEELRLSLLQIVPEDATETQADLLIDNIEKVIRAAAPVALRITRTPPRAAPLAPKPDHSSLCFRREIGRRIFHFRGFLRSDDDGFVTGEIMLERVRATGDEPAGSTDSEYLEDHRDLWVHDPELAGYRIVTGEHNPAGNKVRYFGEEHRERHWSSIEGVFYKHHLVVCRPRP